MNWVVNGQSYPVLKIASLLGGGAGLGAAMIASNFQSDFYTIAFIGASAALAAFLAILIIFLIDIALSAKAEGEMRRARLRAAARIYSEWAEGTLEPPTHLRTATIKVNGEVRRLDWLEDDDPDTRRWRECLIALFQHARAVQRDHKGERTGLTEADLIGDGRMFSHREPYLNAIRVAKDLGLVVRINGMPTRMADDWTYTKAVSYLQTSAVLPPIKHRPPPFRAYAGSVAG